MSKHLVYGTQQFQLRDDEDVEALASRFTQPGDADGWVTFENHAGDQLRVLRNAPFPVVISSGT